MFLKTSTALAVAIALTACGGGGGGSSGSSSTSAPAASLTSANYSTVSNSAAAAVADAGSSTSLAQVASVGDPAQNTAQVPASAYSLAQFALAQIKAGPLLESAQAVTSQTVACTVSGTGTVSINDANNNNQFDAGDSATISFYNCSFAAGQAAVSGSMTLNVSSLTSSGSTLTGGVFSITFNNMTSGNASLNGTMGLNFSSTFATLTYTNFTATRGSNSVTYGYTATEDTSTSVTKITLNGPITLGGVSYTIATVTPLTYTGAYASAGLLRVSDAAGDHADITPNGAQFTVSYYAAGSSTASASYTSTWSSILH